LGLLACHHTRFRADMDKGRDAAGGEALTPAFVLITVVGLGANFHQAGLLEGEAEVPDFEAELYYKLGEEGELGQWTACLTWWFWLVGWDMGALRRVVY
jgi:hypothetical protein